MFLPNSEGQNEITSLEKPDWAVPLLRRVELWGLWLDFGKIKKTYVEDAWWVAQEEEVTGPYCFSDVLKALLDGVSSIQIMHSSQADEEAPIWILMEYRPLWMNPRFIIGFKVGLLLIVAFLVYITFRSFTPYSFRWIHNFSVPLFAGLALWHRKTRSSPKGRAFFYRSLKRAGKGLLALVVAAGVWHFSRSIDFQPWVAQAKAAWTKAEDWVASLKKQSVPAQATVTGEADREKTLVTTNDLPFKAEENGEKEEDRNASVDPNDAKGGIEGTDNRTEETTVAAVAYESVSSTQSERGLPGLDVQVFAQPAASESQILALFSNTPADWPKTLLLKKAVIFPAMLSGKVIGQLQAPAGASVKLVAIQQEQLLVEFQGGQQKVAFTITDLMDRILAARKSKPSADHQPATAAPATSNAAPEKGSEPPATSSHNTSESIPENPVRPLSATVNKTMPGAGKSEMLKRLSPDQLQTLLEHSGDNRKELENALAQSRDNGGKEMELLLAHASQYDLVNLTAEHLLHNVSFYQKAMKEMRWSFSIPEEMRLEYVLPYRVADEDLDDWRPEFYALLSPLVKEFKDSKTAARAIHQWLYKGDGGQPRIDFKVSESRDQTPRQMLNGTKIGRCFEMNLLLVSLLRSVGIPACHAGVAWWGNSPMYHYWVEYWDTDTRTWLSLEPNANPDALAARGSPFAVAYAFPGYCDQPDPIGRECWDAMINVTASYAKQVGTLALLSKNTAAAAVTFSVYSWNTAAWRLAATAKGLGKASFELSANEKQFPYLASASVNGKTSWRMVRVVAGKTETVTLGAGIQEELLAEYKM